MTITQVTITLSVLLFGQVFGNIDNNGFDNNGFNDNRFNDNGFNDNGFDNNGFNDNYFENGFDDNGLFLDRNGDGSFPVEGGILGSAGVVGGGVSGSHSSGHRSFISPPPQPRFDGHLGGQLGGAALGGRFNPISTRPMVFPRKMPMPLPPIGGGIGGFQRYPKFGRVGGGILGGRRQMFPRRRISSPIGGSRSHGFRKDFRFGMMGRGGIAGLSQRRFKTY